MASEFEASVTEWVADNLPQALVGVNLGMYGPDTSDPAVLDAFEVWRSRLADKGWGAPTWPVEYGGAGLTDAQAKVITKALARAGSSNPIPYLAGMGVTMVGPTMLEYGPEEQKAKHLPGMASGKVRWCLGLSEPNAGSDLAALKTRGTLDGDHIVVNGAKMWTTDAKHADFMELLIRTDPDSQRHKGLTWLICDMNMPGITVRPIQSLDGEYHNCEVFYDDVRIPLANVVGELAEGKDAVDAFFAGMPAGTVSGAPKVRAMEIIDELEPEKRGVYGGGVGYFSAGGDMDMCIALRTAVVKDSTLYIQAGGGVVYDSDPEAEYQETVHKSNAIRRAAADAARFTGNGNT